MKLTNSFASSQPAISRQTISTMQWIYFHQELLCSSKPGKEVVVVTCA